MSVLSRSALESSPLADLHAIASELGIDGFRRLRKAELVDRIVAHQGGDDDGVATDVVDEAAAEPEARPRRRRGGRGGRGRAADAASDEEAETDAAEVAEVEAVDAEADVVEAEAEAEVEVEEELVKVEDEGDEDTRPARRSRGGRGRGGRDREDEPDRVVEGVVELLANGSGFVRLTPPEPSDDDVYISGAQVRRCELVSGDRVGGPARRPRRAGRHPAPRPRRTDHRQPAQGGARGNPV